MTQSELVSTIAGATGHPRRIVEDVLKSLAEIATAELRAGLDVPLPGLGKLSSSVKPARSGRNPATGATIEIAARRVVKFGAAKALKDGVA